MVKIIPPEVVQKYQLVPVNRAGSTLIVAVSDPSNLFAIEDIKFMTGYNVEMVVASESISRAPSTSIMTSRPHWPMSWAIWIWKTWSWLDDR